MPAVDAGRLTIRALSIHENCIERKKQGSGDAEGGPTSRTPAGCGAAAQALRAHLSASHHGTCCSERTPQLSAQATRFYPGRNYLGAGVTRSRPSCSAAVHRPQTGHRAGRAYPPGPPGSDGDEPLPAGTDSRSVLRSDRMTSLYVSEIERHFSNLNCDVKELFPDPTCAHLAGLFELCEPRHQRLRQCVLSTKIRCDGNGLSLLREPDTGLAFRRHFKQIFQPMIHTPRHGRACCLARRRPRPSAWAIKDAITRRLVASVSVIR